MSRVVEKEVSEEGFRSAGHRAVVWALGALDERDMGFLWEESVAASQESEIVPSGDKTCGLVSLT
jgi:hypothetical protein